MYECMCIWTRGTGKECMSVWTRGTEKGVGELRRVGLKTGREKLPGDGVAFNRVIVQDKGGGGSQGVAGDGAVFETPGRSQSDSPQSLPTPEGLTFHSHGRSPWFADTGTPTLKGLTLHAARWFALPMMLEVRMLGDRGHWMVMFNCLRFNPNLALGNQ